MNAVRCSFQTLRTSEHIMWTVAACWTACAAYLHDHITEERLHDFGIMINSLKHIRKQFEKAWRHGAGDPDDEEDHGEYSHINDADAKVIVDALKDRLGGTVQEVDGKAAAFALARIKNPQRTSSLGAKLRRAQE